jgi:hypothetical protein
MGRAQELQVYLEADLLLGMHTAPGFGVLGVG